MGDSLDSARVIVLAGPNGAGKTTAAPGLLRDELGLGTYVNADLIAAGLSGFAPETAAREAGRIMLHRLNALEASGDAFAFESTLSGTGHAHRLHRLRASGYHVVIFFLWLPDPELAVARVETRARHGGHHIPPDVVRRRHARGLVNFLQLYRALASEWRVYDCSGETFAAAGVRLIARGEREKTLEVRDHEIWERIMRRGDHLRESPEPPYVGAEAREGAPGAAIDRAMASAFHQAVRLHRAYAVPLVVWHGERIRHLDPWEVRLPEDPPTDP